MLVMAFTPYVKAGKIDQAGAWMAVGAFIALLVVLTILWTIDVFLQDFVTPIMYLQGGGVMAAWGEFHGLLMDNLWTVTLYLHVKAALILIIVVIAIAVACVLCCISCLPIIGPVLLSVVLLPLGVFMRCYSIDFLAQYGGEYGRLLGPPEPDDPGPPAPPGPPGLAETALAGPAPAGSAPAGSEIS